MLYILENANIAIERLRRKEETLENEGATQWKNR